MAFAGIVVGAIALSVSDRMDQTAIDPTNETFSSTRYICPFLYYRL